MAFYVIRGGRNAGIYENWHDAVNAGWFQRQPYGNAVKVESVEDAEAFLAITRKYNRICFLCDCPHTIISTHIRIHHTHTIIQSVCSGGCRTSQELGFASTLRCAIHHFLRHVVPHRVVPP